MFNATATQAWTLMKLRWTMSNSKVLQLSNHIFCRRQGKVTPHSNKTSHGCWKKRWILVLFFRLFSKIIIQKVPHLIAIIPTSPSLSCANQHTRYWYLPGFSPAGANGSILYQIDAHRKAGPPVKTTHLPPSLIWP